MTASQQIDEKINALQDWRGELYAQLRHMIGEAQPQLTESWKWETAVWVGKSNICALAAFKDHVKLNFFVGAALDDPHGLFNSGLDSKKQRSIDFPQGSSIDTEGIRALVEEAVKQDAKGK